MIRIVSLIDNVSASPDLEEKHGLSLYIETAKHKLLFDLGQDKTFIKNAEKLGINVADVDTVIISHGHYDHGGGLKALIDANRKAKIYVRRTAFGKYFNKTPERTKYIGLDEALCDNPRLIFTEGSVTIDDELMLFADVSGEKLYSSANDSLQSQVGNEFVHDGFNHEQYLIITDGDRQVLITGCSHKGIVNIVEQFNNEYKTAESATVIGGFHLYENSRKHYVDDCLIFAVADELKKLGNTYFTCHCTGEKAYVMMKERMDGRLSYFAVGNETVIE